MQGGDYRVYYPSNLLRNAHSFEIGVYINNSLHLARKHARIFVLGLLELRSGKTVRFSEQIISADKYPSIFSRQMEAIIYM